MWERVLLAASLAANILLLMWVSAGEGALVDPARAPRAMAEVGQAEAPSLHEDVDEPTVQVGAGVYGLMRDWGCGHGNMQVPKAIQTGGRGDVIVDVGLFDAAETVAAVKEGFTVIGFEPMPSSFRHIKALHGTMGGRITYVELQPVSSNGWFHPKKSAATAEMQWLIPKIPEPPSVANGRGSAVIILAALDSEHGTAFLPSGRSSALSSLNLASKHGNHTREPNTLAVPKLTLDSILPEWAQMVHLLKLDTQGVSVARSSSNPARLGRSRTAT